MGDEHKRTSDEIIGRIGTFLILLGVFFIILFAASDASAQPNFDYLFLGLLGIGIGFLFRRRLAPPPPSGRFSSYNKWRERAKQRKEEKAKKAKK